MLGSGLTAYPILQAIKNLELQVIVAGNNREDICHRFADRSLYEDYSDFEAMAKFMTQEKVEYVVPGCNDAAYRTAVALSQAFGTPGYDSPQVARFIYNKMDFREGLSSITDHVPRFQKFVNGQLVGKSIKFPALLKPLESSTGFGIIYLESERTLEKYLCDPQVDDGNEAFLVEEFFSGSLHSVSIFFDGDSILEAYFVDEYCTDYPYAVNESCAPSKIDKESQKKILIELEKVILRLGLVSGFLHTQILFNGDDFKFVESMRRCPGDLFGLLVDKSYGSDYYDSYARSYLGGPSIEKVAAREVKPIARQTITNPSASTIFGISYGGKGKVCESYNFFSSGAWLEKFPMAKQGIVFVEYENKASMYEEVGSLKDLNRLF